MKKAKTVAADDMLPEYDFSVLALVLKRGFLAGEARGFTPTRPTRTGRSWPHQSRSRSSLPVGTNVREV